MAVPIIMPKFSMTQEEAIVLTWLVDEGDVVTKGDPLMEVETDKVAMEVEAPEGGILRGLKVNEGDVVPVTEVIGYIVPEGETWTEEPDEKMSADLSAPATSSDVHASNSTPIKATPIAQRIAASAEIDISEIPPPRNDHKIRRQHVEQYLLQLGDGVPSNSNNLLTNPNKFRATPAARRLARERNLTLKQISGSGPLGRIQVEDVARFEPREVEAGSKPVSDPYSDSGEVQALSRMRRAIADRMMQNYQSIPHITFTVSVDMTAVIELRRRLNVEIEKEEAARVSVTVVLAKVCAWALERHPLVNAAWSEAGIQLNNQVNIGIAVALDEGLIVPVVQNVASLGLLKIARQMQELSTRARSGHLHPQDVQGGTFTISNLGMFGIDQFTAIINAPQSAILAVGQTVKQPIVVERPTGDEMVIRPMMKMTLSVDHRIVDGAVAARFLQDVVAGLEQPDRMLW